MKRIFTMSLALILVLSLMTGCGKNKENGAFEGVDTSGTTQENNRLDESQSDHGDNNDGANIDFDAIFAGRSDIKLTNLSESEKQKIIDAGEVVGVYVMFTDIDDDVFFTRLSDGYNAVWSLGSWTTWSDSDTGFIPAEWPNDDFTRLIPNPNFDLFTTNIYEDTFTAVFRNVTLDQIKTYTESVKNAGFAVNPKLDEKTTYKYTASNGKGYSIELTRYSSSDQTVYLIITKAS